MIGWNVHTYIWPVCRAFVSYYRMIHEQALNCVGCAMQCVAQELLSEKYMENRICKQEAAFNSCKQAFLLIRNVANFDLLVASSFSVN